MEIAVTITPGLSPMDRGWVEDELAERLAGEGAVELIGGGTLLTEPPVSDFQLGVPDDADAALVGATCREFLASIPFTIDTTLTLQVGEGPVETIEVVARPADS